MTEQDESHASLSLQTVYELTKRAELAEAQARTVVDEIVQHDVCPPYFDCPDGYDGNGPHEQCCACWLAWSAERARKKLEADDE